MSIVIIIIIIIMIQFYYLFLFWLYPEATSLWIWKETEVFIIRVGSFFSLLIILPSQETSITAIIQLTHQSHLQR